MNYIFFSFFVSGLFRIFYLYCTYVRHDLLFFHPCALAVFCCQHLRLGAICLAHRYVKNGDKMTLMTSKYRIDIIE